MIHELKCDPEYFEAVKCGDKTFEVRRNDRGFGVGDILALNKLDDTREGYDGDFLLERVTYVLDDPDYCKEGYVVLGIKQMKIVGREDWEMLLR